MVISYSFFTFVRPSSLHTINSYTCKDNIFIEATISSLTMIVMKPIHSIRRWAFAGLFNCLQYVYFTCFIVQCYIIGLLPDTQNCVLRMRRECRERFSPPPWFSDPDIHHGTCVMYVPGWMPGSLTNGFLWSRWRGKRFRHSRRMRNPQIYVSDKRPMVFGGVMKIRLRPLYKTILTYTILAVKLFAPLYCNGD